MQSYNSTHQNKGYWMKILLILPILLFTLSSLAKVSKSSIGDDLNFKFEMPKKEIKRSLASERDKKEVEKVNKKKRDPASQDDVDKRIQRSGIEFWKF